MHEAHIYLLAGSLTVAAEAVIGDDVALHDVR